MDWFSENFGSLVALQAFQVKYSGQLTRALTSVCRPITAAQWHCLFLLLFKKKKKVFYNAVSHWLSIQMHQCITNIDKYLAIWRKKMCISVTTAAQLLWSRFIVICRMWRFFFSQMSSYLCRGRWASVCVCVF